MFLIDQLNLNHLRIFECVFRNANMTKSASELHLTQSGVSQHIKSLEEFLGIVLFDRVRHRLVPTAEAKLLYDKCVLGFSTLEETLLKITGKEAELYGTVTIGLPPEFGYNIAIPILSQFSINHELVTIKLKIAIASSMNDMLLEGEVDFAFVDDLAIDKRIQTERVYDEYIELCATPGYLKRHGKPKHDRAYYEKLDYVAYLENEPILRMWFKHHLPGKPPTLNCRAYMSDCHSVASMIKEGAGVGAVPSHMVAALKKAGYKISVLTGNGRALHNAVRLAIVPNRSRSLAAEAVLQHMKVGLAKQQARIKK